MMAMRQLWFIGAGLLGVTTAIGAALAGFAALGASSPSSRTNGITVSGWWTIDVKNPDGTLAVHREFENSLLSFGTETLARFVSRQNSTGLWIVQLGTDGTVLPTTDRPCLNGTGPSVCAITEPSSASAGLPYALNDDLQVSLVGAGASAVARLSGSTTAQKNGQINWVVTSVSNCPANVAPASPCSDDNSAFPEVLFTNQLLNTPIPVTNGQTINVQVDFSFH